MHRFREGDLTKELLVSCYLALRTHYFMQLGQRLDEAGRDTWQVSRGPHSLVRHRLLVFDSLLMPW